MRHTTSSAPRRHFHAGPACPCTFVCRGVTAFPLVLHRMAKSSPRIESRERCATKTHLRHQSSSVLRGAPSLTTRQPFQRGVYSLSQKILSVPAATAHVQAKPPRGWSRPQDARGPFQQSLRNPFKHPYLWGTPGCKLLLVGATGVPTVRLGEVGAGG